MSPLYGATAMLFAYVVIAALDTPNFMKWKKWASHHFFVINFLFAMFAGPFLPLGEEMKTAMKCFIAASVFMWFSALCAWLLDWAWAIQDRRESASTQPVNQS